MNPTVVVSKDLKGKLMTEEIVGPVFTVYVYPYGAYEETLQLLAMILNLSPLQA